MANIDNLQNTNELETSLFYESNEFDDEFLLGEDRFEEKDDRQSEEQYRQQDDRRGGAHADKIDERQGEERCFGGNNDRREAGCFNRLVGRSSSSGNFEGGRECNRSRNHRCCCIGPRGPRGCQGERGPRGITTLLGGIYLENASSSPMTIASNEAVPLSQVRNTIGNGISFVNNTVVVVPGTYYFSWSVLTKSNIVTDPNVVITLENIIGMIPKIATSGNMNPISSIGTAINATGSTVVTFRQMAALRLINDSGHSILLLGANGEGANNFKASLTVLRLA